MNKKTPSAKTNEALLRAYEDCQRRKRLRPIDKGSYTGYVQRGQKDFASAERDFASGDFHWVRIKAYQALFHTLNALLIKRLGHFSKDHGCILLALRKHGIITEDIAKKLRLVHGTTNAHEASSEDIIDDIGEMRMHRNFALYEPKPWDQVTSQDIRGELDRIRQNIIILTELL